MGSSAATLCGHHSGATRGLFLLARRASRIDPPVALRMHGEEAPPFTPVKIPPIQQKPRSML